MIDREALRAELIRAAGGNVESDTRQDFARRPLTEPPRVKEGADPWRDFDRYWERGFRLYCYRALQAVHPARLTARAADYRCNLALWYDLSESHLAESRIILQVTPTKFFKPASVTLPYLAAFWVAVPPEMH